jgi:hypothetical protein
MSNKATIESVLAKFFQAVKDCDMDQLPVASQVSYSGTMLREPARGAGAVKFYMSETAPFVKSFSIEETVIGSDSAAVMVRYEAVNGVVFEGCYFMDIEDGLITRIRTVFDSLPLMKGGMDPRA